MKFKNRLLTLFIVFSISITSFICSSIESYANPLLLYSISDELFSLLVGCGIASGLALETQDSQVSFVNTFLSKVASSDDLTVDGKKVDFPFSRDSKVDSARFSTTLEKFVRRNVKKDKKQFIPNQTFISFFNHTVNDIKKVSFGFGHIDVYDNLYKEHAYKVTPINPFKNNSDEKFENTIDILGSPYKCVIKYRRRYSTEWVADFCIVDGDEIVGRGTEFYNYNFSLFFLPSKEHPGYYYLFYPSPSFYDVPYDKNHGVTGQVLLRIPSVYDKLNKFTAKNVFTTNDDFKIPNNDLIEPSHQDFGNFEGDVEKPIEQPKPKPPVEQLKTPPKSEIDFKFDWHKLNLNNFNLKNKFPFSIPWDFANIIKLFDISPKVPSVHFNFMGFSPNVDFSQFNDWVEIFRFFLVITYVISLMFLTKKII